MQRKSLPVNHLEVDSSPSFKQPGLATAGENNWLAKKQKFL
jgi:hypothetical protein